LLKIVVQRILNTGPRQETPIHWYVVRPDITWWPKKKSTALNSFIDRNNASLSDYPSVCSLTHTVTCLE